MADRSDQWRPNVTVAAIAERDGRFLIVEEQTAQGLRYNQPAGHLEAGETLLTQGHAAESLQFLLDGAVSASSGDRAAAGG